MSDLYAEKVFNETELLGDFMSGENFVYACYWVKNTLQDFVWRECLRHKLHAEVGSYKITIKRLDQ